MADLSQDEIDDLISGALSGEEEDDADLPVMTEEESPSSEGISSTVTPETPKPMGSVRGYDFRKPTPIPEDQKKTIALLHEQYAQKLKINLSAFLRTEVDVSLENVEQVTFAEYISSLSTPTCITSFDMQPLNGIGLIETNAVIAYAIVDRMLGGSGFVHGQVRPFTDVELAIVRKLVDNLLVDLHEAWKPIVNISFVPKEVQTNPAMVRIIAMKELALIITLNVKIKESSGLLTICIPYANLEPIAFKLGSQQWNKYTGKQPEDIYEAILHNFYGVPLDVTAMLGKIQLSMHDVLALQVGDIIDLGVKTKEPVKIQVAGVDKFLANPGLLGKQKAISIVSEVKKE